MSALPVHSWLSRLVKSGWHPEEALTDEVFIDDTGFVYGADSDIGPAGHDEVVLETVLSSVDNFEELESLEPFDLNPEQMQQVEANYPGFLDFVVSKGGLPKEYAVLHMGWIRVLGNSFETGDVTNNVLENIANYAASTSNDMRTVIHINDRNTGAYETFTLGELIEALDTGQGELVYKKKVHDSARSTELGLY